MALWIALRLDLNQPYWAMATVYIVAQPLIGAMRSKAIYRFCGTLLGAIGAIALVPNLVDGREVLVAGLALWTGICIYFSVLDRTPRAYVFLLAGYTVAIIGFPSVDAPGGIWDVALARVEEITLGIACVTVIGGVVLPRPLGQVLIARIDAWLRNAVTWSVAVLRDRSGDPATGAARQRLAADVVEIGMLASNVAFDSSHLAVAARPLALLQERVLFLLPVVSGLGDRLAALRQGGGVSTPLQSLLDRTASWIDEGAGGDLAEADHLTAAIAALSPPIDGRSDWNAIMRASLLVRLRDLVELTHDIMALRRQIGSGMPRLPKLDFAPEETRPGAPYRDHVMALHSAAAAVLAIGLVSAFWIAAAWPEGGGAATLVAIGCSFFAAQDDPVPSLVAFLGGTVVALLIDATYLFAVLPVVPNFEMLVLVLAPVYLLLGVLMSIPATARIAGPVAFIGATELAISSRYDATFPAFVNGAIAAIAGVAAAAIILKIVRSVGADWMVRRLLRANRATIAAAAVSHHVRGRVGFADLMLDRLSLVATRLAVCARGDDSAAVAALADLRVGINVVDLRTDAANLPADARSCISAMLEGLAAHYARRTPQPPAAALLDAVDRAIAAVAPLAAAMPGQLLLELVGIRRALFPAAPPYVPDPPPPALSAAA